MDNAYVAICKCGGLVMAAFCIADNETITKQTVAEYRVCGFEVKKMTVDDVMKMEICKYSGQCGTGF